MYLAHCYLVSSSTWTYPNTWLLIYSPWNVQFLLFAISHAQARNAGVTRHSCSLSPHRHSGISSATPSFPVLSLSSLSPTSFIQAELASVFSFLDSRLLSSNPFSALLMEAHSRTLIWSHHLSSQESSRTPWWATWPHMAPNSHHTPILSSGCLSQLYQMTWISL